MLAATASKTQPTTHTGVSTTGGSLQDHQPLVKGGENDHQPLVKQQQAAEAPNPVWSELQHLSQALGFPSDMFTPSAMGTSPFSNGLPLTIYESPTGVTIKVVSAFVCAAPLLHTLLVSFSPPPLSQYPLPLNPPLLPPFSTNRTSLACPRTASRSVWTTARCR